MWEVYDDRPQYMAQADASRLDGALQRSDVSAAWVLWSGAAEDALADATGFAGSPKVPSVVCGPKVRGVARFTIVRLGGPKVRKACGNACGNACGDAADPLDGVMLLRTVTPLWLFFWT